MRIDSYKKLIKKGEFFEAHEALEEFWFPRRKQKDRVTLIVKGFINAAVSFELFKRGRLENSKRVWQTYKKFSSLIKKEEKEFLNLKKFVDDFARDYFK